MANLVAPTTALPGSRIKVSGSGFPADKVYLTLDGQGKTTNVFGAPTFEVWLNVSSSVRVQTLVAYLKSTGAELARTTINVQKAVPTGISNVTVSTTPTSATIAWDVVPASPGQIRYGLTNQYGKLSGLEPSALSHHVQTLSGLTPGTLYHFAIVSGTNSPDSTLTTCWAP